MQCRCTDAGNIEYVCRPQVQLQLLLSIHCTAAPVSTQKTESVHKKEEKEEKAPLTDKFFLQVSPGCHRERLDEFLKLNGAILFLFFLFVVVCCVCVFVCLGNRRKVFNERKVN